jgi:hypothetical protein
MTMHPDKFADPIELHRHADRNGLAYAWEFTRAFAKWQELLTREQYELVEVRTSQGASRAMLFSRAMKLEQQVAAERERWRAIQRKRAGLHRLKSAKTP